MRQMQIPERGQTLVILALGITALMLMVGLAIDVGQAYNDRRDMQTAADAAALAGAQQLCDGKGQTAALTAADSVGKANGATLVEAVATLGTTARSMQVTTRTQAPTYFFRIVGINSVPIAAHATAQCSCATTLGAAWPILFDMETWYNDVACDETFLVWAQQPSVDPLSAMPGPLCSYCNCTDFPELAAWGAHPLSPGRRGWASLTTPLAFSTDPTYSGGNNCGDNALKLWLEVGYPGQLGLGDCVATQSGADLPQEAKTKEGKEVSILIYDPALACTEGMQVCGVKCCPGDLQYIVGTGCVLVQKVYLRSDKLTLNPLPGYEDICQINGQKIKNEQAILVKKVCGGCQYSGSGSSGGPTITTCVPAVSLTQ